MRPHIIGASEVPDIQQAIRGCHEMYLKRERDAWLPLLAPTLPIDGQEQLYSAATASDSESQLVGHATSITSNPLAHS